MVKEIILLTVLVPLLGVPRSVLAQHDHGGSQPDAGAPSRPSDPGIEQVDQIHKLTAKLAVLNERLQESEDLAEIRQGLEEQGRVLADLRTAITEHHALMMEQQPVPAAQKTKKKGCGHHSVGVHH